MNFSYWEKSSLITSNHFTIIGSGIVGLFAAIEIVNKFPAKKVVVIERNFLPEGASTKNAGFACFGSVSELSDDLQNMSLNQILTLVEMRFKGLEKLVKTLGKERIEYKNTGNWELFSNENFKEFEAKIEFWNQNLKDLIGNNTFELKHEKSFHFNGFDKYVFNQYEGSINTGLMMRNLIELAKEKGITIFNGLNINRFEENQNEVSLYQNDNLILKTNNLIICNNGFAQQFLLQFDVKPARNNVFVTSKIQNLNFDSCFHIDRGYTYFRNVDANRILIGGARNLDFENEQTTETGINPKIKAHLMQILKENIIPNQNFTIDFEWSGVLGVGKEKFPIIKKLSPRVYCAIRMGGMGVAIGSIVGQKAAEMMEEIFD